MYTLTLEKSKKNLRLLNFTILFIALFWISKGKLLIALLLIAVALIGFYINRKKIVLVSEGNIFYPYVIDKKILWNEVSNILLKDDVLTIDLKNNELLQATLSAGSRNLDEQEFNNFCAKQLGLNRV